MTPVRRSAFCFLLVAMTVLAGGAASDRAGLSARADQVDILLPAAVTFFVANRALPTTGNPSPTLVAFSNASIHFQKGVRISVRADSDFIGPGGASIPASRVSWTAAGAVGGTAYSGTVDLVQYTAVLQGAKAGTAGSALVTWILAPITGPVAAGSYSLVLRWRIESVTP